LSFITSVGKGSDHQEKHDGYRDSQSFGTDHPREQSAKIAADYSRNYHDDCDQPINMAEKSKDGNRNEPGCGKDRDCDFIRSIYRACVLPEFGDFAFVGSLGVQKALSVRTRFSALTPHAQLLAQQLIGRNASSPGS
jgi:hypothetical protein